MNFAIVKDYIISLHLQPLLIRDGIHHHRPPALTVVQIITSIEALQYHCDLHLYHCYLLLRVIVTITDIIHLSIVLKVLTIDHVHQRPYIFATRLYHHPHAIVILDHHTHQHHLMVEDTVVYIVHCIVITKNILNSITITMNLFRLATGAEVAGVDTNRPSITLKEVDRPTFTITTGTRTKENDYMKN